MANYKIKETNIDYGCGIEKLEYIEYGDILRIPEPSQMMNKINEIIDVLDRICGKR